MQQVRLALERRRVPFHFLDDAASEAALIVDAHHAGGSLLASNTRIDLSEITGAYLRPYDQGHSVVARAMHAWAEVASALVINRPAASSANNSKPYQSMLIARAGFSVPETLITTDENAVREFKARHRHVIYKSVSGVRSIVTRLVDESVRPLSDVRNCPTQFQEYVPGDEYRVHVIGSDVFACRVESDADDYRFARDHPPRLSPAALTTELATQVHDMVHGMGLIVAGADLRRHPDGRWFCFEVNPSPAFTYYDDVSGNRMADAIAALLVADSSPGAAATNI